MKFKKLLQQFMNDMQQLYFKDVRGRRNTPRGQLSVTEEIGKKDFIRLMQTASPQLYLCVVEYKQGRYQVVLMENFVSKNITETRCPHQGKRPASELSYAGLGWQRHHASLFVWRWGQE